MSHSLVIDCRDEHAVRYHAESRERVARLAEEGRGREALAEGARLLGIDISKGVRARLISLNRVRLA